MKKIKITVAIPNSGVPKILYAGPDADKAIKAWQDAKGTIDGEVLMLKNPVATRRWKGPADKPAPRPTKKSSSAD